MISYTYLLFDGKRYYIGSRLCRKYDDAQKDWRYLGSSSDKEYSKRIKSKQILSYHNTHADALKAEVYWHDLFKVDSNKLFANKARITSKKFRPAGYM